MTQPQLRVSFSGLCLFDFNPPLSGGVKPTSANVLLQRLTRARPLSRTVNAQPEVLDQHFPLLEFNLADWSPEKSTRKADFHCLPDANGRMTKGVCLLNGEDVTLHPDGDPEPEEPALELSRSEPMDTVDPKGPSLATLWWMAPLEEVFPDNPLDARIRGSRPGSNQPILARVKLNQGYLKTRELTNSPCTIVGTGPSDFNRRVATSFALEIGCRETVEVRMTAMRNGRRTASKLVLYSKDGADLEIGISNMEIDRFIGMDPADGPRAQGDFETFSNLLRDPIQGPKPFLRESGPGNSSGCCGRANCLVTGG